jgi:PAS domain S-box-containing protein
MNDEIVELLSLKSLGLADKEDLARLETLLASGEGTKSVHAEMEDFIAEAMALTSFHDRPSALLKERVMVATEPSLAKVVTDASCGIVSISNAFSDLCGYRLEEIKGKSPGSFLQGVGTDPAAIEVFREAIRKEKQCEVTLLNYHKSGSPYWVNIRMSPVFECSGNLAGYTALEEKVSSAG